MLYIIGGAPRTGKSLISRDISVKHGVSRLWIDLLITALQKGAPELNIKHGQPFIPKAKKLWSFIRPLSEHSIKEGELLLIEGDGILPIHAHSLEKKFPRKVKSCFFGFIQIDKKEKLDLIRSYEYLPDEWTSERSDEQLKTTIENMIKFSKYLKEECAKLSIPYFEVGKNLPDTYKKVDILFFG